MRIEKAHAQVHENRTLARTNARNKTGSSLISCYRVSTIDFFSIYASSLCPCDEITAPLNRRRGRNRPTIILDNHQYRQLVDRSLAEKHIEVVRCYSTIPYGECDNFLTFVTL